MSNTETITESHSIAALIKNPAFAHSINGSMLLSIIAVLTLQPSLLPYSVADHEHDLEPLRNMVANQIDLTVLKRDLRTETKAAENLNRQIQFNLCLDESCKFEKSQHDAAKARIEALNRELDRAPGGKK